MRLMSFCTRPTVAAKIAVVAPMKMTKAWAVGRQLEQRRQPRHHEHAGGHHGGGVDERGDRRRALHGVGQPGVQQELRRLAHRAHEQQQTDDRQRVDVQAQEVKGLADEARRLREDGVEIDRAGEREDRENAERKAEIADAVDDEGLDRGRIGFRLVDTRSRSADSSRARRLPSRRTAARDCRPSPASAWRR